MYRSFLSWRYLVARRTNLIGIVGILVGVGALILILSIMTGFLELSRSTVRGSLSDLIISPVLGEGWQGLRPPDDPEELLAVLRARPEVVSATAHMNWFGLVLLPGRDSALTTHILSSSTQAQRSGVQIIGIDVRTNERILLAAAAAAMRVRGIPWRPPAVQDELSTTELLRALALEPRSPRAARVENPLLPFADPPDRRRRTLAAPRVIVGEQILSSLGLTRGSEIVLATAVPDPAAGRLVPSNRTFVVAGSFRSGDNEMDLGRVYVERSELADFLGGPATYHEVLVKLRDYDKDGQRLARELRATLAEQGLIRGLGSEGEVRTWEEFRGNLLGAIENERVLMMIMLSLVLLVAGFTVFAILSMMVTEKRRDIGILCAVGATPKGILDTFLYIAFWDALIGATLGAVLGTWGALRIDAIERWISGLLGVQIFNRDVYLFDHIPSIVDPLWVGAIVLGAFACALCFAAIPALRAARMDPLEALRYE